MATGEEMDPAEMLQGYLRAEFSHLIATFGEPPVLWLGNTRPVAWRFLFQEPSSDDDSEMPPLEMQATLYCLGPDIPTGSGKWYVDGDYWWSLDCVAAHLAVSFQRTNPVPPEVLGH